MKETRKKSLGAMLIAAIEDAIANPSKMKTVYPSVARVRKNLQMTQSEFAKEYHINIKTLRQWEQGLRSPDSTSLAYLECIAKAPKQISEILNGN